MRLPHTAAVFIVFVALAGCAEAPRGLGVNCGKTSECDTPLVCRLQSCRNECNSNRDCAGASICLLDEAGLGACRLEPEANCTASGDCEAGLACVNGQCANACTSVSDCAPGTLCLEDGEPCAGGTCGCFDPTERSCSSNLECPGAFVCGLDGRCRAECTSSRDCRFGGECVSGTCETPIRDAAFDVVPDSSVPPDGGADALMGACPPADLSLAGADFDGVCGMSGTSLFCWGRLPLYPSPRSPSELIAIPAVRSISFNPFGSGESHACAVRIGGDVVCFGSNMNGELGDGTMISGPEPRFVVGLPPATRVSAGRHHTCAVVSGAVWCWGTATNGELGDGRLSGVSLEPVEIGFDQVQHIDGSADSTCALRTDGTLHCWGNNATGQAALTGDVASAATPMLVSTSFTSVQLSMGAFGGCVVDETRRVHCWGDTPFGVRVPTLVPGVEALQIAMGAQHVCAVTPARELVCWGMGGSGQLGVGTVDNAAGPGDSVVGLSGVQDIVSGGAFSCAQTADGTFCWGNNVDGQLGANGFSPSSLPIRVRCVP